MVLPCPKPSSKPTSGYLRQLRNLHEAVGKFWHAFMSAWKPKLLSPNQVAEKKIQNLLYGFRIEQHLAELERGYNDLEAAIQERGKLGSLAAQIGDDSAADCKVEEKTRQSKSASPPKEPSGPTPLQTERFGERKVGSNKRPIPTLGQGEWDEDMVMTSSGTLGGQRRVKQKTRPAVNDTHAFEAAVSKDDGHLEDRESIAVSKRSAALLARMYTNTSGEGLVKFDTVAAALIDAGLSQT